MTRPNALLALVLTVTALAGCTGDGVPSTRIVIDFPEPHADVDDKVPFADLVPEGTEVGVNARHQLLAWSVATGTDVDIREFTFGNCLDAIDHVPPTPGCDPGAAGYWALSLNGETSQAGMDEVVLHAGDVVTWTYTPLGNGSSDPPALTVDAPAPTQQDMVMLTGTLDRPARLSVGETTVDAEAGPWMVHVNLEYGRTPLLVIADDGMATTQVEVVAVRLAAATFEAEFTAAVPPHAAIREIVWYDPDELASASLYNGTPATHPPTANVHDLMVAWERQAGKTIDYSEPASFGFGVDKIDGVGQPLSASAPPYWCYTLNGQTAELGISAQELAPGDIVKWEYGGCAA